MAVEFPKDACHDKSANRSSTRGRHFCVLRNPQGLTLISKEKRMKTKPEVNPYLRLAL